MKKLIARILVVLMFALSAAAQNEANAPRLFDVYERLSLDDNGGRLINLWLELDKTKNSKALIRIYGGYGRSFAYPYIRGSALRMLSRIYNLPAEKFNIQFCNVNNQPFSVQSFVVREDDKVEPCEENLSVPKETTLFEEIYFSEPEFKLTPLESSGGWEGAQQGFYSAYAQAVLKRLLAESPAGRVYLVGYLQAEQKKNDQGEIISKKVVRRDRVGLSKQMIRSVKNDLIKNGVSPSQIATIDGGYEFGDARRVELWFVPAGGAIPQPKPEYIPKKRK